MNKKEQTINTENVTVKKSEERKKLLDIIPSSKFEYFNPKNIPSNIQKIIHEKIHLVSIDRGFGSMKVVSHNGKFVFPSYVTKIDNTTNNMNVDNIKLSSPTDILIKYEDVIYRVGEENRQQLKNSYNTSDIHLTFVTEDLIDTIEYKVSYMAAIALAFSNNFEFFKNTDTFSYEGKIKIGAGVPIEFANNKQIENKIASVLSSIKSFSIRTNNATNWKEFELNIDKQDIEVIGQPLGTLESLTRNIDGTYTPIAEDLYSSEDGQVVIADGGYGSFDTVLLNSGIIEQGESWYDCATKSILENISKEIDEELKNSNFVNAKSLSTIGLEKALKRYIKTGTFHIRQKENGVIYANKEIDDIEEIISKSIKACAGIATNHLDTKYGDYEDLRLICTGGSTQLMKNQILSYCDDNYIKCIWAEQNYDGTQYEMYNFNTVFANAMGYYARCISLIFEENNWDLYSAWDSENEEVAVTEEKQ